MPGFPKKLRDPAIPGAEIITTAALGDITGDGKLDIVTPTQEFDDNPSAPADPRRRRGRRLLQLPHQLPRQRARRQRPRVRGRPQRQRAAGLADGAERHRARRAAVRRPGRRPRPRERRHRPRARGDRQRRQRRRDGHQRRRLERRAVRLRAGGRRARRQVEGAQPVREPDRRQHRRRRRARGHQGRRDAEPGRQPRRRRSGQNLPYNHVVQAWNAADRRLAADLPAGGRGLPAPVQPDGRRRLRRARQRGRRRHRPLLPAQLQRGRASRAPAGRSSPAAGSSPRRRSATRTATATSRSRR